MNTKEIAVVWITKYALTRGIFPLECEILKDTSTQMIRENSYPQYQTFHYEGKQWSRTKEEAITVAEKMRIRKMSSLMKQVKKLENLNFS